MTISIELTGEVITFLSVAVSAVAGIVGYTYSRKDRHIDKLEKEINAYRLREDAHQDRELELLRRQLDVSQNNAGAQQYLARSLEDQTSLHKDQRAFFVEVLSKLRERS